MQLTVVAADLGTPSLSSTAQVTVNVIRNNFAPEFTPPQYAKNIDFTKAINEEVVRVTARDRDSNVSTSLKLHVYQITACYHEKDYMQLSLHCSHAENKMVNHKMI